ncbi:MAG: hypothetical protein COT24_01120 [Candidatus Kerfeldbacteria bacterium CG08_land_8_20_14_0_20_40_16]|uniref:Uncharacterized protein n=1 Tax=Candidatus Kerfeldbacteria bacterium CG08_land_8_20_14_0_20_40_16 TaxID=2014244 RepID=A0A2H0YYP6_9BACT|nr:MAG: hypothetical protein COT24_01120 [Candidatus Kerfeldbacteria bacterium CG08_land_8_20_14_0_20_40_16]
MPNYWWKETKNFFSKASFFILVVATIDYLVLFIFNSLANNFIATFFDIKVILIIMLVSGALYVITKE